MRLTILLIGLLFLGALSTVSAQSINNTPKLNQIGFYPSNEKIAIIPTSESGTYSIIDYESGAIVYQGSFNAGVNYSLAGERVAVADFSDFTRQGTFQLIADGIGISFPFDIKNEVFDELANAITKAMYFNRASTALSSEHAGVWSRSAGQLDNSVIIHPSAASPGRPAGSTISSPGGWYDAGDFNKYVVPISSSISQMLFAYESYPDFFNNRELNIPESGDAVPDVLDEALYALRWLLTMQDPHDGGVYNKLTYTNFQATVMPNVPNAARYVVQKGTAATLDFSAVMAQAARVYEPFYPDFADSALVAAELAFDWAEANPNVRYDQNQMNQQFDPDIGTGGYGDSNFSDEFFWARSELYITTKNDDYYSANGWAGTDVSGWPNVRALGLFSLIRHRTELTAVAYGDTTSMKNELISTYENYVNNGSNSPYRSPFGFASWQFGWGSNGGAGNLGMGIMMAFELTGEHKFYDGAIHIMDYILGRNPVAYSYVTGFGDQTPMFIHHRQSEADGIEDPIPGWVAGGANSGNQSQDCGASRYNSTLPAASYLDGYCSYSTNEITTYWNAPFVFLTAAIESYTENVVAGAEPLLKFSSPAKNQLFGPGDSVLIAWDETTISTVDLLYKRYSDESFTEIASNIDASTGEYTEFTLPSIPGDSLFFMIRDSNDANEFAYSSILKLRPPRSFKSFTVTSFLNLPFNPGRIINFRWSVASIESVNLSYYLTSDSVLVSISDNISISEEGTGSFNTFFLPDSPSNSIVFRVEDSDSSYVFLESEAFEIVSLVNNEIADEPVSFQLFQNYPNPFNPSTIIGFNIAEPSHVLLTVHDITGRVITTITDGIRSTGKHELTFDASELSSGIYFYRLQAANFSAIQSMMLIK